MKQNIKNFIFNKLKYCGLIKKLIIDIGNTTYYIKVKEKESYIFCEEPKTKITRFNVVCNFNVNDYKCCLYTIEKIIYDFNDIIDKKEIIKKYENLIKSIKNNLVIKIINNNYNDIKIICY